MTDQARTLVPNTASTDVPSVLLPYQQRWISDPSPLKVCEKGRRTGLTWAEAADDVLIAASSKAAGGQNVYYLGTDKEMTEEFIGACAMWAKAFNHAASAMEEGLWDEDEEDKHIKTFTIRFPASGHKITALASRPRKLRGRQGVLVGDESAFVDDLAISNRHGWASKAPCWVHGRRSRTWAEMTWMPGFSAPARIWLISSAGRAAGDFVVIKNAPPVLSQVSVH